MAVLRSFPSIISLVLSVKYFAVLLATARADSTVSIISQQAFTDVRPCVQQCIWCGEYWLINCPGGAIGLNNVLSCNGIDALFCRTDHQASASSYLTTCIYSQCATNAVDLSDGLSLYNGYCSVDGATLDNYPTTSTSPPGTITPAATPGSTPTVVIYSTITAQSSTRATVTSEWPLKIAVALAVVLASGVDLFS